MSKINLLELEANGDLVPGSIWKLRDGREAVYVGKNTLNTWGNNFIFGMDSGYCLWVYPCGTRDGERYQNSCCDVVEKKL